ncbi:MAG: hypothetical protein ACI9AR_000293 [Flavobacteriaceae bacterium]|jgi:hypothetical protein
MSYTPPVSLIEVKKSFKGFILLVFVSYVLIGVTCFLYWKFVNKDLIDIIALLTLSSSMISISLKDKLNPYNRMIDFVNFPKSQKYFIIKDIFFLIPILLSILFFTITVLN